MTRTRLAATRRAIRLVLAVVVMLPAVVAWAPVAAAQDPVIAAAGDIACAPEPTRNAPDDRATSSATSDLLVGAGLAAVLPLGDIQYDSASLAELRAVYDPTWGRVKSITRPVLGNHESWQRRRLLRLLQRRGRPNGPAGPRGKGYYSYDVGGWHLIALNSNCVAVACTAGSAQEQWLRADLAAHPTSCTLAYWHHPRFSSGHDGNNDFMQPIWQALYDAGADARAVGPQPRLRALRAA